MLDPNNFDAHALTSEPPKPVAWRAQMLCCGRDEGFAYFGTWKEANDFRESYTSGPGVNPHGYSGNLHTGHQRCVIVNALYTTPPATAERIAALEEEREYLLADWNAVVKASGSKTNGGAVGHVAALRAEVERLKSVTLTDAEIVDGFCKQPSRRQYVESFHDGARWAEAALRAKASGQGESNG